MAKVEIEESDLANLMRVNNVAAMLGNNPKTRGRLQELVAEAAPEQAGPEVHIRREVTERVGGIEKKFDEFMARFDKERQEREDADRQRDLENRWLKGRTVAKDAGYTAEGVEQLEAWMEKNGIADHKIAMAAYERENPPPEPVATGGSRWNFFGDRNAADPGTKALNELMSGNDEAFLASAIPGALKEVRGG